MTGPEIKALRERLKLSQQELADYLGLRHRSQVTHLESGRTAATGAKLRLLLMLGESRIIPGKKRKSC